MNQRFTTQRSALAYLLIISFIGWVNAPAFPGFAQGQTPAGQAQKTIEAGNDIQTVNAGDREGENPGMNAQAVEKAESAKPKVKKKHFPWLGVILSLALAGGLVYYFFILKTTLQVNTIPAGARIYLDGKDSAQVSPCLLKSSIGGHTIKAVLEGYADLEQEVVVKNGKNSLELLLDIGTFEVTAPGPNANVQRETACPIRWDSSAMAASDKAPAAGRAQAVTKVDLELFQNEAKVGVIALGVPNSGSYTWDVPAATQEGHNFKVMISCSAFAPSRAQSPLFNLLGFKEDFTDGSADFWLADNGAAWNVSGGYYTATQTSERFAVGIYDFFYGESSYAVESRMRWSEYSGSSGAPLFIMLGNSNRFSNNSGYALGYSMDGMIRIYRSENCNLLDPSPGSLVPIYTGSSGAVSQGLSNWNTVKVVRSGSSYALFINNTLVYTLIDDTYNPTHVMIGFAGAGVRTRCDFDYVHVTVNPGN